MHSTSFLPGFTLLATTFCGIAVAAPSPVAQVIIEPTSTITPGGPPCGENGPENRGCWRNNWRIDTDYEEDTPPANLREVTFDITESPNHSSDGGPGIPVMLVNGQYPGPTLRGNWGDFFQITVNNKLVDNGTSIHWHGLRQHFSNNQDGVNGITECPIPPGESRIYTFRATQYGTSWYHSHFSVQYGNGVFGPVVINGPASADYDIDLGPYTINDWYYDTADFIAREFQNSAPPPSENILFNGTNVSHDKTAGEYSRVALTPGAKHLLRLINPSTENHFHVSLVGHQMTIIATDFVPVEPKTVDSIFMAVGQRYDIIIEANQDVDNYWFNATVDPSALCGTTNADFPAAIFSYDGAGSGLPTDTGTPLDLDDTQCMEDLSFVPVVPRSAAASEFQVDRKRLEVTLSLGQVNHVGEDIIAWWVNGSAIDVHWDKPTLQYVMENNVSFIPDSYNMYAVDTPDVWTYWIIQNIIGPPHPIHLHGHDFLVLGASSTTFDPETAVLNFDNPMRRDVAMLPTNGYLVMAFRTDNPGAWLMHCHIAWHVAWGLSVQYLERWEEVKDHMHLDQMNENCDNWRSYSPTMVHPKIDSGLRA